MPNVHLKNDALKCSWVVKIHNNPSYSLCPSFDFYSKMKYVKHIEQRIAIKNNKTNQFNLKWQIISDI